MARLGPRAALLVLGAAACVSLPGGASAASTSHTAWIFASAPTVSPPAIQVPVSSPAASHSTG
ncbi:MAG: hypothetical protein ACYDA6_11675, partial [Solirubrobacteraceae bacterium]